LIRMDQRLSQALAATALAGLLACSGGGGSSTAGGSTTPAAGVVVSLTSATITMAAGMSQTFSASVTGNPNTAVTWTASAGSITAAGVFTAPTVAGTVTITATSVADPTKKASTTVTVTAATPTLAITVIPAAITLASGATQTFTATVTGSANTAVTWTASAGSITPGGVFTAPATVGTMTLTATAVADTTRKATATVTVVASGTGVVNLPSGLPPAVVTAVTTGNALNGTTVDDLLSATLATIEHQRTSANPIINQLFNLNADGTAKADGSSLTALTWDPTHDATLLGATFGTNTEVLVSNVDNKGAAAPAKGLAVVGTRPSRYLVLGSNPFRTNGINNANTANVQMNQFLANAIQWLTGKPSGTSLKVALAQLDESYWFKDETTTRAWLTARYGSNVTFNAANAYDGTNLGKILTDGADLVIVSQQLDAGQEATQVRDGIKALMDAGIPVLYVQLDGGINPLGTLLYNLFQVQYLGDNYWTNYAISGLNGASLSGRLSQDMSDIREMLTRLKSGTYDFSLATCQTSATELAAYKAQFQKGASAVKSMMNSFDASRRDLFTGTGLEVPKLLALLGDRIRQDIVYPYKTASSSPKDFLRAYYADHAVYNVRQLNPAQKDLGTFSRSSFNSVVPTSRTVSITSRPSFRGTGAYALPGRTVKVTRLDSGAVNTSIFVNTLRSGSTHEWDDTSYGGYSRPKFLWSASIPVKPGETVYFTSPYGGPLQVSFDQKDVPVRFLFENVSEHPYWNGPEDDGTFASKLNEGTHDWVEVATDGFEMHSKLDRFKTGTLADSHWNTPRTLAAATQRYTYNYSHILAGFQGDGIDKDPEVHGWAVGKGLLVPTTDVVKHMNADVPTCGWGCSGNPYDAGWAFTPIGHGDVHELGHSLQSGRWQLKHGTYTYPNHAGTNFYAYYVQSRAWDDMGALDSGQHGMPFKAIFQQLQAGYKAGDRVGSFSTTNETYFASILSAGGDAGIDNTYTFYTQFFMQVRQKGLISNGWHVLGRVHMIDRCFRAALKDQATWDAQKATFGFDQVAFADAQTMSNNDFMAIALSFAGGLDLRDYMGMWGFRVSASADAQIASFKLPAAERVFFAVNTMDWVKGALTTKVGTYQKLTIDGTTAWPLP